MNHYIFLATCLLTLPLSAQNEVSLPKDSTLNRTVVVEQAYNPDIVDASKINLLPQMEEPAVRQKTVEYATAVLPAEQIPADQMEAYNVPLKPQRNTPTYIRLGYGTHNNVDIMAHYYDRLSSNDLLKMQATFSGIRTRLDDVILSKEEWKSHFYRTRAALDYTHSFNRIALNIGGDFGLSNFNTSDTRFFDADRQKFSHGGAQLAIQSNDSQQSIQFKAGTGFKGYNRRYVNLNNGAKEWQIRTIFELEALLGEKQAFTVKADMENLFYNVENKSQNKQTRTAMPDDRTLINLNPYYELKKQKLKMHLGVHADFSIGSGTILRAAPDIQIEYPFAGSYVIYAQATGGRTLNDFRRLEAFNPYARLEQQLKDSYEQANVNIGLRANPANGLWFNIIGGYQNLKNDIYAVYENNDLTSYYTRFGQTHTSNWYASLQASYNIKDIWSISFETTFRNWKASQTDTTAENYNKASLTKEKWNPALLLKPRVECHIHMDLHPLSCLWFNFNYHFRKHEDRSHKAQEFYKIQNINNLSCDLTYDVLNWMSIYIKADNILNQHYQTNLLIPNQGFCFMGGLSARF